MMNGCTLAAPTADAVPHNIATLLDDFPPDP
ncbi:hypothetical protein RSWS8N_11965 [Cereibacter sphaeroides WS8N]|nr:hypothetical protein RSWS8N_11965 [Cereibacter sphaeroides WS8N]